MMGESYHLNQPYRPKCCGCGARADGRINYAGANTVVDNPFCHTHFSEIYRQTVRLLKEVYPKESKGEFILVQKWDAHQIVPGSPFSIAELMSQGTRISHET